MTQEPAPRYVLVSREGVDTVHRNPREECNLDDTEADQEIDRATAAALLAAGQAEACQHCGEDPWHS